MKNRTARDIKNLRLALANKIGIDVKEVGCPQFQKISNFLRTKYSEYLYHGDVSKAENIAKIYNIEVNKSKELKRVEFSNRILKSENKELEFKSLISEKLNIKEENIKSLFFRRISTELGKMYNLCKKSLDAEKFIKFYKSEIGIYRSNIESKKEFKNLSNKIKKEVQNVKYKKSECIDDLHGNTLSSGWIISGEYDGKEYRTYVHDKSEGLNALIKYIAEDMLYDNYDPEFDAMLDDLLFEYNQEQISGKAKVVDQCYLSF